MIRTIRHVGYVDGIRVAISGRVSRFRKAADRLGLKVPKVLERTTDGRPIVHLGAAPLAADLRPLVALLEDFDGQIVLVELARDHMLGDDDPDRFEFVVRSVRLRPYSARTWTQYEGTMTFYAGHRRDHALTACAYPLAASKADPMLTGPVLHRELRVRGPWLDRLGITRPADLLELDDERMGRVHLELLQLAMARHLPACVRARARA